MLRRIASGTTCLLACSALALMLGRAGPCPGAELSDGASKPVANAAASSAAARTDATVGPDYDAFERQPVGRRSDSSTAPSASSPPLTGAPVAPNLSRGLIALMFVLGLIMVAAYLLRRLRLSTRLNRAGSIEIIARSPVNSKQSLCLVKFADRLLVVGVSPNHIAALDRIDDPEEIAHITGLFESAAPDSVSNTFKRLFQRETKQYETPDGETADPADWPTTETQQWHQAHNELSSLLDKVKGLSRLCFPAPRPRNKP